MLSTSDQVDKHLSKQLVNMDKQFMLQLLHEKPLVINILLRQTVFVGKCEMMVKETQGKFWSLLKWPMPYPALKFTLFDSACLCFCPSNAGIKELCHNIHLYFLLYAVDT